MSRHDLAMDNDTPIYNQLATEFVLGPPVSISIDYIFNKTYTASPLKRNTPRVGQKPITTNKRKKAKR